MGDETRSGMFGGLSAKDRKEGRRVLGIRADIDERREQDGEAWMIYRLELSAVVEELSAAFPELPGLIQGAVGAARAKKRTVIMSDVFGDGDGRALGADVTVNLALTGRNDNPGAHKTVTGNAYDGRVQEKYFKTLDAEQGDLAFAVFNPWGGVKLASEWNASVVAYSSVKLFSLFRGAYQRLASPGVMYVMLDSLRLEQRDAFLEYLKQQGISFIPGKERLSGVVITKGFDAAKP